jgi:hypothetical protein
MSTSGDLAEYARSLLRPGEKILGYRPADLSHMSEVSDEDNIQDGDENDNCSSGEESTVDSQMSDESLEAVNTGSIPDYNNQRDGAKVEIYDTEALRAKLAEISYKIPAEMKRVPWIERLDIVSEEKLPPCGKGKACP